MSAKRLFIKLLFPIMVILLALSLAACTLEEFGESTTAETNKETEETSSIETSVGTAAGSEESSSPADTDVDTNTDGSEQTEETEGAETTEGFATETTETESETETDDATETDDVTETTEVPTFNYFEEDMREYVSFDKSDYSGINAVISSDFRIDSEDIAAYVEARRFENRIVLNYGATIVDQPVQYVDSAFIYYTGYVDGEAFAGGSNMSEAAPYELVIGSGTFIPGFEEALIGLIPAETSKDAPAQITVTFPENYGNDLAGKEAIFDIWIVYIIQYELPEYNESFITEVLKFEAKGEDIIAEYEASVAETLENNIASNKTSAIDNAMWDVLLERFTVIKYPESEVKAMYDSYISEMEYYYMLYSYYGYSFESFDAFAVWYLDLEAGADWQQELTSLAERYVSQYLIYYGIAQAEGMTVSDEEYADKLAYYIEYYKDYGYTDEELEAAIGADGIKESVLFDKVYALLQSNITVSFDE